MNKKLTFKIPNLDKLKKHFISKDKEEYLLKLKTEEGKGELVDRYSISKYRVKMNEFELTENEDIISCLKIKESYPKLLSKSTYRSELFDHRLSVDRISQKEFLLKNKSSQWDETVKTASIIGEEFVCEYAIEKGLKLERISELDFYNKIDCRINNVDIDVKTKVRIGSKSDLSLNKNFWDCSEKIFLTRVQVDNYTSNKFYCYAVGVLDKELIEKNNLKHMLQHITFITEPFFVDADRYFEVQKNEVFPNFNEFAFNKFLFKNEFLKLRAYFGEENYLLGLKKSEKFEQFSTLLFDLAILHKNNASSLSALCIFNWLLNVAKTKQIINWELFKESIFDLIDMTIYHKKYLSALVSALEGLYEKKCKFSNLPLSSGEIIFKNNCLVSIVNGKSNVLFAYSRYSGELLTIMNDMVCDESSCACLLHSVGNVYYGKASCPRYGIERDLKMNIKKEFILKGELVF